MNWFETVTAYYEAHAKFSVSHDGLPFGYILRFFLTWCEAWVQQQQAYDHLQKTKNSTLSKPAEQFWRILQRALARMPSVFGIVTRISALQLWFLIPRTDSSQSSGSCETQKERTGCIPGARDMDTNTKLATGFLSASIRIEVAQDNAGVPGWRHWSITVVDSYK